MRTRMAGWAALLALMAGPLQAAGTDGASFLSIPVGGRPAAVGGAYSAAATDAYAPVWNAAGLGFTQATQLTATHLDYAAGTGYEFLGFAHPLSGGRGVGACVQYLHPKSQTARDATGSEIGSFSSYYAAYSLAYGQQVASRLSLGAALKAIDARIADASARAFGADFGALWKVHPRVTVALVAANLGTKLKFLSDGESLADTYRLGLGFSPGAQWTLLAESGYARDNAAFGRVGAEWRPVPLVALRAGYRTDATRGLSGVTGLTTGIGLEAFGQRFDYAWVPMGSLGQTQHFSVMFTFGGPKK